MQGTLAQARLTWCYAATADTHPIVINIIMESQMTPETGLDWDCFGFCRIGILTWFELVCISLNWLELV